MESTVVVIVAILALIGGAVALLTRQGMLPRAMPSLRGSGGAVIATVDNGRETDGERELRLQPASNSAPRQPDHARSPEPAVGVLERADLVAPPAATSREFDSARLDRIETRLTELHRLIAAQGESRAAEMQKIATALTARADAGEARRDAAGERLRADVLAAMSAAQSSRPRHAPSRNVEVSAELYARLARLEAAFSAVTNPMLLPGEAYEPPVDFLPEALIWENWNDVGERVFALADDFNARRVYLSPQTRADVGAFVTTLRRLLTRSVYPNLQPDADPSQRAALRAALAEIATALTSVRDVLDRECQEESSR